MVKTCIKLLCKMFSLTLLVPMSQRCIQTGHGSTGKYGPSWFHSYHGYETQCQWVSNTGPSTINIMNSPPVKTTSSAVTQFKEKTTICLVLVIDSIKNKTTINNTVAKKGLKVHNRFRSVLWSSWPLLCCVPLEPSKSMHPLLVKHSSCFILLPRLQSLRPLFWVHCYCLWVRLSMTPGAELLLLDDLTPVLLCNNQELRNPTGPGSSRTDT